MWSEFKNLISAITPDKCKGGATQDSGKNHEKKCEECIIELGIEEYKSGGILDGYGYNAIKKACKELNIPLNSKKGGEICNELMEKHTGHLNIIVEKLDTYDGSKRKKPITKKFSEEFKSATDKDWKKARSECLPNYPIKPESFTNMTEGKSYYVNQPSGTQDYPDLVLIKKIDNMICLLYIECKQPKPTWNNNPPKRNRYCMYICGNKIFNGYLLLSELGEKRIKKLIKDLKKVIDEFNDVPDEDTGNIKAILYKKPELISFPPPDFNEKENDKLNETIFNEFTQ